MDTLDRVFEEARLLKLHKDMLCNPENCVYCLAEKNWGDNGQSEQPKMSN